MTKAPADRRPLSGYVIIEGGSIIAASYCGQLLADFGATVIKIEAPKGRVIDPLRRWGHVYKDGEGFLASILNRNKKLITLDISTPEGAQLFTKLLVQADVLLENYKPGTLAAWGFDDEKLADINDKLIHVAISGYGRTGPMAKQSALGAIAEAMGGLRSLIGYEDRPPVRAGVSIGDSLAGLYAAFGTAMALLERDRSHKGQTVDVAIYESVLGVIEDLIPTYKMFDIIRGPVGTGFDRSAPSNIYPTSGGGWVLIASPTDTLFHRLVHRIGMPELLSDSRFSTQSARADHKAEIDAIVAEWASTRDAGEIVKLLNADGIPCGKLYNAADLMSDPHVEARDMVVFAPDERVGAVPMQGVVPKLSRTPGRIDNAGGNIGRDSDEIYQTMLGIGDEERAALRQKRVI